MKKYILLILLAVILLPITYFRSPVVPHVRHFKALPNSKTHFTNVYVGINDGPSSPKGGYYEIYTDGTANVVYVYDYINAVGYTATGLVWTITPPHGFPSQHVQFDAYVSGSVVDSYAGALVQ